MSAYPGEELRKVITDQIHGGRCDCDVDWCRAAADRVMVALSDHDRQLRADTLNELADNLVRLLATHEGSIATVIRAQAAAALAAPVGACGACASGADVPADLHTGCALAAPAESAQAPEKAIAGALRSTIDAHGPITEEWVGSAAKRITHQLAVLSDHDRQLRADHTLQLAYEMPSTYSVASSFGSDWLRDRALEMGAIPCGAQSRPIWRPDSLLTCWLPPGHPDEQHHDTKRGYYFDSDVRADALAAPVEPCSHPSWQWSEERLDVICPSCGQSAPPKPGALQQETDQ